MIIVLVTRGKNESVDYVKIHLFKDKDDAEVFVEASSDKERKKYWTHAQIIEEGEDMELSQPKF